MRGKLQKNLKGNEALGDHVMRFGYFGTKKFLDPDLEYEVSIIGLPSVRLLQKLD